MRCLLFGFLGCLLSLPAMSQATQPADDGVVLRTYPVGDLTTPADAELAQRLRGDLAGLARHIENELKFEEEGINFCPPAVDLSTPLSNLKAAQTEDLISAIQNFTGSTEDWLNGVHQADIFNDILIVKASPQIQNQVQEVLDALREQLPKNETIEHELKRWTAAWHVAHAEGFRRAGDVDTAVKHLRLAKRLDPDSVIADSMLGVIRAMRDEQLVPATQPESEDRR